MDFVLDNSFQIMDFDECYLIEGGTFWGVVAGVSTVVGGALIAVGGVILILTPEPTGITKAVGTGALCAGFGTMGAGVATIVDNL